MPSSHQRVLPSGRSIDVIDEEFSADGRWGYYSLTYFTDVDPKNRELLRREMNDIWRELRLSVEARGSSRAILDAWDRNWHTTSHRAGPRWDHGDSVRCAQLQRKEDGSWEYVARWSSDPQNDETQRTGPAASDQPGR